MSSSTLRREGRVEGLLGRLDLGQFADELQGLRPSGESIHSGVFPLHRHRVLISDEVQHPEDALPGHVAVAGRDEIPSSAGVGPRQVGSESTVAPVELLARLLQVHVVDPVLEVPQESDRVEVLPHEVTGVEVQSESRPVADGLQRPLRGPVVGKSSTKQGMLFTVPSKTKKPPSPDIQNTLPSE